MSDPLPVLRSSIGLTTLIDPTRLKFDPKNMPLAAAYNIDHDRTGRISRRKGTAETAVTASCHSLFCDNSPCYFVTGTTLCELYEDYSYGEIATVSAGYPVSYLYLDGKTYWVCGTEMGIIENGLNSSWSVGTYSGPDSTRNYSSPPNGTMLAYHGGCVLVVSGSTIWHSDEYFPLGFDMKRDYLLMESAVQMVQPVDGGVWVSDEKAVWFLAGTGMRGLAHHKKTLFPAIRGTDCKIDLSTVGTGEMNGIGAMWTSVDGICVGTPDGQVFNLTKKNIEDIKQVTVGSTIVIKDRYIALLGNQDSGMLGLCLELIGSRVSQYADFNFNSMCKFGSVYLGANANGIFAIDSGNYDYNSGAKAVITSFFELPTLDFDMPNQKRIRYLHFGYETNGKLLITTEDDDNNETERTLVPNKIGNKQHSGRVSGRRDRKGRYWMIRVDNVSGSDYSIDSIYVTPVMLGREP